jgi:hypothetical protein
LIDRECVAMAGLGLQVHKGETVHGFAGHHVSEHLGRTSLFEAHRLAGDILAPVTLPPASFMLATRPRLTGSPPIANTMGTVALRRTLVAGVLGLWSFFFGIPLWLLQIVH